MNSACPRDGITRRKLHHRLWCKTWKIPCSEAGTYGIEPIMITPPLMALTPDSTAAENYDKTKFGRERWRGRSLEDAVKQMPPCNTIIHTMITLWTLREETKVTSNMIDHSSCSEIRERGAQGQSNDEAEAGVGLGSWVNSQGVREYHMRERTRGQSSISNHFQRRRDDQCWEFARRGRQILQFSRLYSSQWRTKHSATVIKRMDTTANASTIATTEMQSQEFWINKWKTYSEGLILHQFQSWYRAQDTQKVPFKMSACYYVYTFISWSILTKIPNAQPQHARLK